MRDAENRPELGRRGSRRRGPRIACAFVLCLAGAGAAGGAQVELRLLQRDGRPLRDAVLYALPLEPRRLPHAAAAVMDQRDRRFVPAILPVQAGAEVTFPNTDSISHHVYSFSPAKRFEIYLAKGETHPPVGFERPGVVALGCNLHDWMLAYILVVDTPWFAQTDAQGRASLSGLPAGGYRLVVWHPRIPIDREPGLTRELRLAAASAESWQLRLRTALLPARDQEPGFADY
jgi:plastocyanin